MTTRAAHLTSAERSEEFRALGIPLRRFFPHRVHRIPKCGPDGMRLARAMGVGEDPAGMWQLLLYADDQLLREFPRDLFFDDELNWHRNQMGMPGLVGSASLVLDGDTLHGITYVSDLVQRIALRREHKTRVEKLFGGWSQMLFNAVAAFGLDRGASRIRTPASELAMLHTDPARRDRLGPEMYQRIYDRTVTGAYPATRDGDWWVLDADGLRDRVVMPERVTSSSPGTEVVAVCHEIERGLGHLDVDAGFARRANETSDRALDAMLAAEQRAGVTATYAVVGSLLAEVRGRIEAGGHDIAFHSYDHDVARGDQLARCRAVDYRIKGYRFPRSEGTAETSDRNLLFHNFEWVGSSSLALGRKEPELRSGLVRVPIWADDFRMHSQGLGYAAWEADILDRARSARSFFSVSLHDCYGEHWLPHYEGLLEKLGELGEVLTLDDVAARTALDSAV